MTWFYKLGEMEHGPITQSELVELAKTGVIGPATIIKNESSTWVPASTIRGLRFLLPSGCTVSSGVDIWGSLLKTLVLMAAVNVYFLAFFLSMIFIGSPILICAVVVSMSCIAFYLLLTIHDTLKDISAKLEVLIQKNTQI